MKKFLLLILISYFPFSSYAFKEKDVYFKTDNKVIGGTLTIPNGKGPFPVAVFVTGTTQLDRDATMSFEDGSLPCMYPDLSGRTIKTFRDLAHNLAELGIACYRFDLRTYKYMPENPKSLSPNDYIKDIHQAVNAIKKDSIVDSNVIILIGHSEGSNMIPIVAAQRNDIDFIIGLATPARGTDKLLEDKYRLIYKKCDKVDKGEKVVAEIRTSFEKVRSGTWSKEETLSGAYSYYWKVMLDLTDNSVRNYSKLKIPALLIFGSEDYEVNSKDFELFHSQLKTKNSEVVQLKGVNHFMTTNKSTEVSYEVYKTIIDWLSKFSN